MFPTIVLVFFYKEDETRVPALLPCAQRVETTEGHGERQPVASSGEGA